jgi:membrane-bound inhibitor of C-type lysozyme
MKTFFLAGLAFTASVIAVSAMAKPVQPPMNDFNFAFYTCENGGAFQISYNSESPTEATLTTSNNNKQYPLKRMDVSNGVQFSNQNVSFWTDGNSTIVKGTEIPLNNCKLKSSAS